MRGVPRPAMPYGCPSAICATPSCALLSDEGRFAVVLPADEAARFIGICRDVLLPVRRTDVRTTPRHAAKRVLLEFVHTSSAPAPDRTELVIGTGVHEQYTPEYRALTRDFYLKF